MYSSSERTFSLTGGGSPAEDVEEGTGERGFLSVPLFPSFTVHFFRLPPPHLVHYFLLLLSFPRSLITSVTTRQGTRKWEKKGERGGWRRRKTWRKRERERELEVSHKDFYLSLSLVFSLSRFPLLHDGTSYRSPEQRSFKEIRFETNFRPLFS